jgi:hypothetical protein
MLYDPKDHYEPEETKEEFEKKSRIYERLMRLKQHRFLKRIKGNVEKGDRKDRHHNRKLVLQLFNLFH